MTQPNAAGNEPPNAGAPPSQFADTQQANNPPAQTQQYAPPQQQNPGQAQHSTGGASPSTPSGLAELQTAIAALPESVARAVREALPQPPPPSTPAQQQQQQSDPPESQRQQSAPAERHRNQHSAPRENRPGDANSVTGGKNKFADWWFG